MKILDMNTVAKRIGCSKGHVSKLINGRVRGTPVLPCGRVGRKVFFIESTVEEYLKDRETEGRSKWTENGGVRRVH
jgi:predicted DNA-binding transcriptional regulator AlpA